ncbi:chaperone TorD involved in molybdoenzyme TorA maturation [Epsilonproteobacteria bacterium SCGC AD-308-E02]|jgi:putative dimethyl sulfoxide reductase chaperone|nr:chaperone TorD involved in molybdoenzyme TorA maturation [Epsilonproteobacteria bacterium SCGC AD-308-E02]
MQDDLKTEQLARINIYALVSRILMNEVDETLLKLILEDENVLSFFPSFEKWEKRKTMSNKDLIEKELNVDFTNLFLLHLIPYESFYTREDQQMETGGDNPVQALYNDFDFTVELDKARVMSADHIGVELEFMHELCSSELKALEDGEEKIAGEIAEIQYHFLKEHLLEWAPMYLLNVKSEAGTALYFDAADLALEFMLSDFEYLTELKNRDYKYEALKGEE